MHQHVGQSRRIGRESQQQGVEVGQSPLLEIVCKRECQLRLASTVVRQAQQSHHHLARGALGQLLAQEVERAPVRFAREELVAVDQAEQRHRLATKGVDDVVVIDDMTVLAIGAAATALERHQQGGSKKQLEPVVIQPNAQAMPDEARGHGVEDLAQREAVRGGDVDERLSVVAGALARQGLQQRPFGVDAFAVARVLAADDLVDEAAVGRQVGELAAAAQ